MYKFMVFGHINKSVDAGGDLKITGYASTSDTDRVGDIILASAWTTNGGLDNYNKNPIILFNHDYDDPIGKAVDLQVDSRGLKITAIISKSAGDNTWGLINDGVLTTFSVGFMVKDAMYNEINDGFIIKDAELLEISVVSVPCNQEAVFNISKSLKPNELLEFKKELHIEGQTVEVPPIATVIVVPPEKSVMNEEQVKALVAEATAKAIADIEARNAAASAEATRKAAEDARITETATVAAQVATKSTEERLLADFESKLKANGENVQKTFDEMKAALEERSAELNAMRDSKHKFVDNSGGDWRKNKELIKEADNAFLLSKVMGVKSLTDTNFGKDFMQKFNTQSTVSVGLDNLELTVGLQIEHDIWNPLILAPLFPEIQMKSASMTFPIMPDAGYAEITGNTTASGAQPNGNLDPRGAGYGAPYQGITLTEQTLGVVKMISKTYLGNETEEDSLIPILPLIRDSMIRAHQRGVENMFLSGNYADGVYTSGSADGLLKFASTNGRTVTTAASNTKLTSAALFSMRKLMGKYGVDPRDVVYIVSQQAYFELIEDPEFADYDLVGSQANKLNGEVGRLYGSQVLMCDEFATPASGRYFALALNTRNFLVPRLRGVTVESDYRVEYQARVLVTSQRLGFAEKIPNAPSVVGLKYA